MRTILKLKSDGAEALLGVTLFAGCALNVMLVLAFAGQPDSDRVAGPETVVMRTVVSTPTSAGAGSGPDSTVQPRGRAIATDGRISLPRGLRPS